MPLEDPDVIDIVLGPGADGKIGLVIMDAGVTTNPRQRTELFRKKVRAYFGAVVEGHFQQQFPGRPTPDFFIKAVCSTPPTPEMYELHSLCSRSRPEHHMDVLFVQFDDQPWPGQKFRLTDKPAEIPPPGAALQKFVEEAMEFAFHTLRDDCFRAIAVWLENGKTNIGCLAVSSEEIVPCAKALAAKASPDVTHFTCIYDAFITLPGGVQHDALLARSSERGRARGLLFALKYRPRSRWIKAAKVGALHVIDERENDLEAEDQSAGSRASPR